MFRSTFSGPIPTTRRGQRVQYIRLQPYRRYVPFGTRAQMYRAAVNRAAAVARSRNAGRIYLRPARKNVDTLYI